LQKRFTRMYSNNKHVVAYMVTVCFLVFSIFLGVSIGTFPISFFDILQMIGDSLFHMGGNGSVDENTQNIVMSIRLPRVILAGLVGASLALAGASFQGLLQNPLADPYTLGVSSGASLGAVFVLFFGIHIPFFGFFTLPVASILTGFMTIIFVIFFAGMIDKAMRIETIVLTGIIMSSFLGALISFMIAMSGEELRQIVNWLLGSVSMRGWVYVMMLLPFFVVGSLLILANGTELNALAFGEEKAHQLGVNVKKRKLLILTSASILAGAAVAISGTIGFVGLVVPHLNRLLWGNDYRHLLPLSALFGAGFLILADLVSRTIMSPTELPIGVITALIGAPSFAFILMKQRMERRG
jgi:iron complex transport system permease protein